VLFVGRFERRKGLKYLLRAWARVREQAPDARLVIVGTGRSLPRYRSFVQRHEWSEVELLGYVDDERLVQLYHEADIFCAPSTGQESFGIVLLEAMASGKAIVASRIPGYSEVVTDGREGLLVEPKNERALAAGLLQLLQDQALREAMGRAGQAKAYGYRWEAVADRVLACYERAMAHRAVRAVPERGRFKAVRRAAAEMAHLLAR
jgi:phosphatidylinositol alpha-mannosyltransferase